MAVHRGVGPIGTAASFRVEQWVRVLVTVIVTVQVRVTVMVPVRVPGTVLGIILMASQALSLKRVFITVMP